MKITDLAKLSTAALALGVFGTAGLGCESMSGGDEMESAGDNMMEAAEDTGDAMGEMAEDTGDAVKDAMD
ncbi:hypothetical protein [Phycisphaera mikurensis]|uniref:Uncharacterized protein n=1 Tax=Phycisphaera mikurensis (strain NBRC 102666 / KCTC 22515 / FYK2301M01) TaxID=1142394 RepID=I0IB45_PHYMF|nr:hypothetical protein [Phycisphaera mikurensis]MBB6442984.1 hypothetical protein [Phycisphaera mikurensis]BAM02483.1 hypothetical protein PSMK_03240 [Phycisphaera mikurensis NBRC 102666]